MAQKEWKIGDRVAYYDNGWIITTIVKLTKTQGVLGNDKRFLLKDSYLLKSNAIFIKQESEVKEQIEKWVKKREKEDNLAKEKVRLRQLIEDLKLSKLSLEDLRATELDF